MIFKAVIHPEPTGGYWGEVPALPGCYSQGETVEELLANLREAAAVARDYLVPAAVTANRAGRPWGSRVFKGPDWKSGSLTPSS